MTDEQLKEIEARASAAVAGPWKPALDPVRPPDRGLAVDTPDGFVLVRTRFLTGPNADGIRADAEFIAHAREDVPALVAEVRRLRESEERLRAMLASRVFANVNDYGACCIDCWVVADIECGKPPTQHEPTCELAIFLNLPRKASNG